MQGEIRLRTLQLEGVLFRLMRQLDNEKKCINTFIQIQEEIMKTRTTLEQYKMCLDQHEKDERLKTIKRKMLR